MKSRSAKSAQAYVREERYDKIHKGGMSVEADGAEYVGIRTDGNNNTYDLFSLGQNPAEIPFAFTIPGDLIERETRSSNQHDDGLLIGAAAFGFSLIAVGIWWWRRDSADPETAEGETTYSGTKLRDKSLRIEITLQIRPVRMTICAVSLHNL